MTALPPQRRSGPPDASVSPFPLVGTGIRRAPAWEAGPSSPAAQAAGFLVSSSLGDLEASGSPAQASPLRPGVGVLRGGGAALYPRPPQPLPLPPPGPQPLTWEERGGAPGAPQGGFPTSLLKVRGPSKGGVTPRAATRRGDSQGAKEQGSQLQTAVREAGVGSAGPV